MGRKRKRDPDTAIVELERAYRSAPERVADLYAQALIERGTRRERAGQAESALYDYRAASVIAASLAVQARSIACTRRLAAGHAAGEAVRPSFWHVLGRLFGFGRG